MRPAEALAAVARPEGQQRGDHEERQRHVHTRPGRGAHPLETRRQNQPGDQPRLDAPHRGRSTIGQEDAQQGQQRGRQADREFVEPARGDGRQRAQPVEQRRFRRDDVAVAQRQHPLARIVHLPYHCRFARLPLV